MTTTKELLERKYPQPMRTGDVIVLTQGVVKTYFPRHRLWRDGERNWRWGKLSADLYFRLTSWGIGLRLEVHGRWIGSQAILGPFKLYVNWR
jgi:hypothetical protein